MGLLFKRVVRERLGIVILSVFVAHTGWHWLTERGERLMQFPFPTLDAAFLASLMRGMMAVLVLTAVVWIVQGALNRWMQARIMPRSSLGDGP